MFGGVEWLPDRWEGEFYVVNAVIAVITTILLLWHMNGRWDSMATQGQRWRYRALLGFTLANGYTAIELLELHIEVSLRHWIQLAAVITCFAATIISIARDHQGVEKPIP